MMARSNLKETRRNGWLVALNRLARDRRGAGAVEFALLVPILLMIYLGAVELTIALTKSKRTARAAATVADLVAQKPTMKKADLAAMVDVTKSIFTPYGVTGMTLKVSGITIDSNGAAKIAWSWAQDGTRPYEINAPATVPSSMAMPNSFLVHSELSVPHKLVMFIAETISVQSTTITMSRDYFFRPRTGDKVQCSDC